MAKNKFWLVLGLTGATGGCVSPESLAALLRLVPASPPGSDARAPLQGSQAQADESDARTGVSTVHLHLPATMPKPNSNWYENVEITLPKTAAIHDRALPGVVAWQIRGLYTEAVIRAPREGRDYHCGVGRGPGPQGYSLLLPAPDQAGAGPARPKMARHTVLNDPHFTSLDDPDRTVNPFSPQAYFLGYSLLRTGFGGGSPAAVADALATGNAAESLGELDQATDLEPRFDRARAIFAGLWAEPIPYRLPDGQDGGSATATVHELPLEGGLETRFFVWRIPLGATQIEWSPLPLGRLVLDIRSEDDRGNFRAFQATQVMLSPGTIELELESASGSNGLRWVKPAG